LVHGACDPAAIDSVREFRSWRLYHHTMAGRGGQCGEITLRGSDEAVCDASGKVVLAAPASGGPVYLSVYGGGALDTLHALPDGWSPGRGPIVVNVPAGGRATGRIAPADFVQELDVTNDKDRDDAVRYGGGRNPWGRGALYLREQRRPGIALRREGEPEIWDHTIAALADDGTFAVEAVPPGVYEVLLVLRERKDERTVDDRILPEPLTRITVRAGEATQVDVKRPNRLRED
jgi:hypothetical protein